jgi:hypothetical protein
MASNDGRVTVEKAAVNAVIAGCRPEYLPVLLAAVEYACDPDFNLHVMSISTHFAAPLSLLMINVGGAKPGEASMSTFGYPGRYTYCIGENEEASLWPPYHVSHGCPEGSSAVTLFAGEAPNGISDHASRTARVLAKVARMVDGRPLE